MAYPPIEKGTKICVTVTKEGVKIYGNSQAFRTLSKWMSWIADSKESEHYECHLLWNLTSYASKVGEEESNVIVLFDKDTISSFDYQQDGFDLTFMTVEESDIDKLAKYSDSKLLPDDWNEDGEDTKK